MLILTGPFLFSIKETPNFLNLLKIAKNDWTKDFLDWVERTTNIVSAREVMFNADFWVHTMSNAAFFAPIPLACYYVLDVSVKRRRILKTLVRLKGHLHYGNILNAVIDSAFYRSQQRKSKYYGFEEAIYLLVDQIKLERRKRVRVQVMLVLIFLVSIAFSWRSYLRILGSLFS